MLLVSTLLAINFDWCQPCAAVGVWLAVENEDLLVSSALAQACMAAILGPLQITQQANPKRAPAIVQAVEDEDLVVNVDCQDMRKFDVELYSQLVAYPMEVIPLLDAETNDVVVDQFGPETAEQLGPIMVGFCKLTETI